MVNGSVRMWDTQAAQWEAHLKSTTTLQTVQTLNPPGSKARQFLYCARLVMMQTRPKVKSKLALQYMGLILNKLVQVSAFGAGDYKVLLNFKLRSALFVQKAGSTVSGAPLMMMSGPHFRNNSKAASHVHSRGLACR